jgi:uncharacterized delta-60 repeat protein
MTVRNAFSAAVGLILACAGPLAAADGDEDPDFAGDGRVTEHFGSSSATATAIAPFSDGSLLVGGSAHVGGVEPDVDLAVVRYGNDGRVDLGWGDLGRRLVPINWTGAARDELLEIVLVDRGEAILLGRTEIGTERLPALARLTEEGDLDTTFGVDGRLVVEGGVDTLDTHGAARHPDGFLFVGRYCCWTPEEWGGFLYRTDADGEPDPLFGTGGWVYFPGNPTFLHVATQPGGRIVAAYTAEADIGLIQLRTFLPDGSLDLDFSGDGLLRLETGNGIWVPSAIEIAADGSIYVGMGTAPNDPGPMSGSVARVSAAGELDEEFGYPDLTLEEGSEITALAATTDSKIVAAGPIDATGSQTGGFLIARLHPSGAFDSTFAGNGLKRVEFDLIANGRDSPHALALSGGKPVVAGLANRAAHGQPTFATLRLHNGYVFHSTFESASFIGWSAWVGNLP